METCVILLGAGLSGAGLYLAARDPQRQFQRRILSYSILFAVGVAILGFVASKPIGSYFGLLGLSAVSGAAIVAVWIAVVFHNLRAAVMSCGVGAIAAGGLLCAAQVWISGALLILVGGVVLGKALRSVDVAAPTAVLEPLWIAIAWCGWIVTMVSVFSRAEPSPEPVSARVTAVSDSIDAILAVDATVWLLLAAAVAWAAVSRVRGVASA